jgi:hypothetical protein
MFVWQDQAPVEAGSSPVSRTFAIHSANSGSTST